MKDDLKAAVEKFTSAMATLAVAAERAVTRLRSLQGFTTASLMVRRDRWGGMGRDARRFPDDWMSTVCAGMLCTLMPCPSDAHNLQCHHSCHGGA